MMDWLMSIQIGQVMKAIAYLGVIISSVSATTIKLYKVYTKVKNIKHQDDEYKKMITAHDAILKEFSNKFNDVQATFDKIMNRLDVQEDTDMKRLRNEIVRCGESYLETGHASIRQWSSLMEMYSLYKETYHGNSYVESLIKRCEANVSIVGRLDEHGNDIE